MELTGLIPIIRRWATVIIVATGMAVLVGLVLGSNAEKTYEARAQLLVGPLNTDSNTMRASGDLAQTYAQLATTGNLLTAVSQDVGVSRSELSTGVRATANSTTRFLSIRARSHDAKSAAAIANSVSLQLINLGSQDATRPEGKLRVIDAAGTPSSPVSPRLDLIVPLAAVAGLLGSITLILLFEFVGDTAESVDKVESATGGPALAVKRRRGRPGSPAARRNDPLRVVATQVELAAPNVRCVLVTGVARQDGSGALALDLADVWGERRRRVTIVDAGAGEITRLTGGTSREGLSEWLGHGTGEPSATRRSASVELVAAGLLPGAEAIELDEAKRLIDALAGEDGLVVVHASPATLSSATLAWAQAADVTVLVVRRFQGRRTAIEETSANLRIVGATVPFSVLLDTPRQPFRRPGDKSTPSTGSDGPTPLPSVDPSDSARSNGQRAQPSNAGAKGKANARSTGPKRATPSAAGVRR
ncbi:hypothetical protein BH10ACT1_BH10ACT1_36100 [soil metagenome]